MFHVKHVSRETFPSLKPRISGDEAMDDGRTYRVGVSGSYGGLNLGDEVILLH
jgi:hypothetical protein